jgi:hypothetical protein
VFATLFALEMQNLLDIKEDGPLPPIDSKHDLADELHRIKVGGVAGSQERLVHAQLTGAVARLAALLVPRLL